MAEDHRQAGRRGLTAGGRAVAALVLGALAAALAGGCGEPGPTKVSAEPPRPVEHVDQITLSLSPPTPVNWDDRPGPDGVQVKVYFFRVDQPLPVTVGGTLEFLLYEGRIERGGFEGVEPFRVWRFGPEALPSYLGRGLVGWSYAMRLGWGANPPAARSLTLRARYLPPDGPAKDAAPMHVAMRPS
jgi:hypothetical protein